MASVLDFQSWIGGPDVEIIESTFPSSAKTFNYNFGQDISGWTFKLDCQTIIVNPVAFDRNTGLPNFAASQVIGTFPYSVLKDFNESNSLVTIVSTGSGTVNVTHPAGMYTGPILPDARAYVPLCVVGFTWADDNNQINTHRVVKVMAWEPQVSPSDPTQDADYTPIVLG